MRGPTDDAAAKSAIAGPPSEAPLVAVVGDAAFDIHLQLDDATNTDEKLTATGGFRGLGGTGANAAAAIVRLGVRARLHATVGSDLVGRWIEGELTRIGIDTAGVVRADGRSPVAVIVHRPDGRTVIVDRGVADAFGDLTPTTVGSGKLDVQVSWTAPAGVSYEVQSSGDLRIWSSTGAVVREVSPGQWRATVPMDESAVKFYRVKQRP